MKTIRNLTQALYALANSIRRLADAMRGESRSAEWQFDKHLGVHKLVVPDITERDTEDALKEDPLATQIEPASPGGSVFYTSEEEREKEAEREALEQYWESRRFQTDPSVVELRVPIPPASGPKEPTQ